MAELQAIFNAVVMVMGGDDYAGLLKTFAIVGLMVAVGYGFVRARAEDGAAYLIVLGIWYFTLFIPKVDVVIEDRAPATGAPVTVANVPLGLAFFAASTSHVGKFLTDRFETMFSLPADLRFDTNGMMFGSRIMEEMRKSSLTDPSLAQDLTSFVKNCLNPELLVNPGLMNTLINSTDIWQMIVAGASGTMFNPGLAVTVYIPSAGTSQWANCKDVVSGGGAIAAPDSLNGRLSAWIPTEQRRLGAILNPGVPVSTANTLVASQIPAAEGLMIGASRTAVLGIRQNTMINLMRDTSKTIPQLLNDPAAVQIAVAESMAAASSNSSYLVMAKMAEGALPKIRNIIQIVVIAVFPIVMLLIILAGTKGGLVVRSYAMGMFWVQLWAPLYAVLNYVSTMAAAKSATAALTGAAGQTLSNAADLASTVLSDQAIAGIMTISIPMIALALVKGGEVAMSGVVSSVMGPSSATAGRAGDQVGQGNISLGNTSWGSHTANMTQMGKYDSNISHSSGMMSRGTGLSTTHADETGAMSYDGSRLGSNLGKVSGSLRNAVGASAAEQATTSWGHGMDAVSSFAKQFSSVLGQARAFERHSGSGDATGQRMSSSATARIAESARRMSAITEELANSSGVEHGVASEVGLQARAAMNAGVDMGVFAAKMEGALVASGRRSDQAKAAVNAGIKAATNVEYGKAFDNAQQATEELSRTKDSNSGTRATAGISASSSNAVTALQNASESFKKASSFDAVRREMASGDRTVDLNLASAFTDRYGTGAANDLARSPIAQQGQKLQEFAADYAKGEASQFMQYGGRAGLSPSGLTEQDRKPVAEAESRVSPVSNRDAQAAVATHAANSRAAVPGNPNAAPQTFTSENVVPANDVQKAANTGFGKAEREFGKTNQALGELYDGQAGAIKNPLNTLGAANWTLGFIGGQLAPGLDVSKNFDGKGLAERPAPLGGGMAPNDGKSWRSTGRGAEGRITPPNPSKTPAN